MGQVSASSTILIDAEPETVLAAVADYQAVRPKILSPHYSDYRVLEGGTVQAPSRRGSCRPPNRGRATSRRTSTWPGTPLSRRTPTRQW
jgi:hypothetical protein